MLKREWKSLFSNKILLVVLIAIIAIPTIYTTLFLGSMWDPYGEVDHLPVAVVNQDKSAAYNGKEMKVGEELIDNLKDNDSLSFNFVDEDTASKGLENGTYYMVITIPDNFSANATTLMDKNPKKMELKYETNPGTNYIASKMSDTALTKIKDSVSEQVTKEYTKAVFDQIGTAGDGMQEAADGAGKIQSGVKEAASGNEQITTNLKTLADSTLVFKDGSDELEEGLKTYTAGVTDVNSGAVELAAGVDSANQGAKSLTDGAKTVNDGAASLNAGMTQVSSGAGQVQAGLDQVNANTTSLQNGSSQFASNLAQLNSVVSQSGISGEQAQQLAALQSGSAEFKNALDNASVPTDDIEALKAQNSAAAAALTNAANSGALSEEVSAQLTQAAGLLETNNSAFDQTVGTVNGVLSNAASNYASIDAGITQTVNSVSGIAGNLDTLKGAVNQLNDAYQNQINPGIQGYTGGVAQVTDGYNAVYAGIQQVSQGSSDLAVGTQSLYTGSQTLSAGTDQLKTGTDQLTSGTGKLASNNSTLLTGIHTLGNGASQISDGSNQLYDGSVTLSSGMKELNDGTTTLKTSLSDGANTIKGTKASDKTDKMFAAPVTEVKSEMTTVANNGHAMAPYMMSVALWVGCLAFCIMYPLTKYNGKLKSGASWWFSKTSVIAVIAIVQALVMILMLHLINGFNPIDMGRTILLACAASLTFMSIMYFFNICLGKVGSFIMLIFMVVQLAGSAGTYPVEISGAFVAKIHNYLPFTYTVEGFRSTIAGGTSIVPELLVLAVLFLLFTGASVLIFKGRAAKIKDGKTNLLDVMEKHGLV